MGLNFPTALNPALAKIIGTMMKVDYQRAVLLRIPRMEDEPERHFRPTVFICDEYQNFATVGGDNPTGDERFLSLSRQPKCIPLVATQSISSLKEALPNEGVKTLLQAFRTKVFLSTSDPDTARYGSELCGKADRTRDQLHRFRVQQQCQCRLAQWPHFVQQRIGLSLQAVPETQGAAVRGERLLRTQERPGHRCRLRRHQPAAADLLLPETGLPAHHHDLV